MLMLEDTVSANSEVIVTELDDEAVLLNMQTKMYFSLNTTGLVIWNLLDQGLSLGMVAEKLLNEYEVSPEKAQQCVFDLVTQLSSEHLVSVTHT